MQSVRAVIIDLDGVVRFWPKPEPDALARAAFEPQLLRLVTTGAITDDEWRRRIAAAIGSPETVAAWSAQRAFADPAMVALVTELRARVPVVALTNATDRLDADLREAGVAELFDAVVNSSVVGAAKPDRAAFEAAVALTGVPASACAFIDDTPGHVDAARALGMTGIVHESAAQTRAWLAGVLLSPLA
jgi:putative hydrolase of the HAD superfamily